MLLVLDNMEQVIGAAHPWLAGLLHQAPRLKVLVTSRIPLTIDGEQQFLVPPLETPTSDAGTSAAVRLFAERARAVRHDFTLDDGNNGHGSRRSAGAWTGCPWPSSWRLPASRCFPRKHSWPG